MAEFHFTIPTFTGSPQEIDLKSGQSAVFLGANGAGKTRLGVHIDRLDGGQQSHRIGAHRALNLNTKVTSQSFESAISQLLYGSDDPAQNKHKELRRWAQKPSTGLLNDYDKLLAALFADESEVSSRFRQAHRLDPSTPSPVSKLDTLSSIWTRLLPHRQLDIGANSLKVKTIDHHGQPYDAGELSDGERVIFYLIGQCLLCPKDKLIIIDEPELHINKAIINLVFDEIEAERSDCAFAYITHDLDFAVSRQASVVLAVKACRFPNPSQPQNCEWDLEIVPEGSGLEEEFIAAIVGSRQPVLFIEGTKGSLDATLYRWLFPEFTVLPTRSCDAVIHSVVTFNAQSELHRYNATGLIDFDHRSPEQIKGLSEKRIIVLPVCEAENLLLLPDVLYQIALLLLFTPDEAKKIVDATHTEVCHLASSKKAEIALRKTKRRLDDVLKKVSHAGKDIQKFEEGVKETLSRIDTKAMCSEYENKIAKAVAGSDIETLLREVDNKGLVDIAAQKLGLRSRKDLQDFLGRSLRSRAGDGLAGIMRASIAPLPYDGEA